jgi:phytoene desaturase
MTSPSQARHAVVIGSGFGGLAAAIRLRARGWRVTILEANDQLGGRASVFLKDGFSFDAGPTVITAPYLLDELWEAVGRRAEDYFSLLPVDPYYRMDFPDGSSFDYVGDEDRILSQIQRMSPRDVDGYRKLAAHAERIFNIGYLQLAHTPFNRLSDMLRVIPDMVRLQNYRSVFSLVSHYIQDPRLRQAFSLQPLLVGGNPLRTSSIYLLIHWLERKWGVHFVQGGTAALVSAFGRLLHDIGVDIHLSSPVASIDIAPNSGQARSVTTESGQTFPCDIVVSNADPSVVYTRLIDPKHRRKHTDRSVNRKKQSMSLFVAYFGTNRTYENIAHHTIILGDRYEPLLTDIFDRKILADDFSLYLHAPTRTDPSLAPPGHENFYVLSPVPNDRSGIDWASRHDEYLDKIYTYLQARLLPDLKKHLVTSFAVDPRYFGQHLRSHHSAAFGLEPRLSQSAYFRYHNQSEDIDNLFFVGASTHPGAGVPGVITSAKAMEFVIPTLDPSERLPLPTP